MYCEDCGLPAGLGRANSWRPNGTITSKYESGLRGMFVDASETVYLVDSLSERMGYDVSRLVMEGKRKDSAHYTRGLMSRLANFAGKEPEAGEFLRLMASNYAVPGFGRITRLDFNPGEGVALEMRDVYNLPMAQGQAAGVFEAVLGVRGDIQWEGDERCCRAVIRMGEEEPDAERRIAREVEQNPPLSEEGDRHYRPCAACSAPLELAQALHWDVEKALIVERRSGRRFVFDNVRGLTAVMKILVEELGEDMGLMLAETARGYAREYYASLGETGPYEEEFTRMALFGWGLPTDLREEDGGYSIRLINPFHGPLMAGRIWGFLEAATGKSLGLIGRPDSDGPVMEVRLSDRTSPTRT